MERKSEKEIVLIPFVLTSRFAMMVIIDDFK